MDMAKKTSPGMKPEKRGKAARTAISQSEANDQVTQVHDLAWIGQHDRAIALATQGLAAGKIKPALQMNLLDLRAESYIAQGKLDLAAKDTAAMVKLANEENRKSKNRNYCFLLKAMFLSC